MYNKHLLAEASYRIVNNKEIDISNTSVLSLNNIGALSLNNYPELVNSEELYKATE